MILLRRLQKNFQGVSVVILSILHVKRSCAAVLELSRLFVRYPLLPLLIFQSRAMTVGFCCQAQQPEGVYNWTGPIIIVLHLACLCLVAMAQRTANRSHPLTSQVRSLLESVLQIH